MNFVSLSASNKQFLLFSIRGKSYNIFSTRDSEKCLQKDSLCLQNISLGQARVKRNKLPDPTSEKTRSVRIHCFNQTFVTGTDTWQESFLKQKRFALAQVQSFQPCLLGPCLWVWRWRQQDGVTRSCYWGTEINQGPDASIPTHRPWDELPRASAS